MTVLNLLAVMHERQKIRIVNTDRTLINEGSCLWMWECNICHEYNILRMWFEDNILYIMIKKINYN